MTTSLFRRGLMVAGALLLTAGLADAQGGRSAGDPTIVPELQAEFDRAEKLGLPVEPLMAKAREGYLKQASPKQVRDAVRGMADRMVKARKALQPVHGTAELVAGADALQQNIPESVLHELRAARRTRSIEVPLGVLTELVVRRVPLQRAVATVTLMLERDISERQMIVFGAGVQGDIAAGVAPTVALDIRSRGVLSLPQSPLQGTALDPLRVIPPQ